jgi:Transcriptional regulator of RNA polII, SAGA, subunit
MLRANPERKDTVRLKQELADALGDQGKLYWEKLADFLTSKCTKQQLDDTSRDIITREHESMLVITQLNCITSFCCRYSTTHSCTSRHRQDQATANL